MGGVGGGVVYTGSARIRGQTKMVFKLRMRIISLVTCPKPHPPDGALDDQL